MYRWLSLQALVMIGFLCCACLPEEKRVPSPPVVPTPAVETVTNTAPVPTTAAPLTDPVIEESSPVSLGEEYLSQVLNLNQEAIHLISAEKVQWNNACLGLLTEGEMCAEVITDGYLLVFEVEGKQYELHSLLDGSGIRMKNPPRTDLPSQVEHAREVVAKEFGLRLDDVTLVSYTEKEWPDACMGRKAPDLMCAQVITPGYEIVFDVYGKQVICVAAIRNQAVRIETNPFQPGGMKDVLILLDQQTPECHTAMFSDTEVTTGKCGSDLVSVPYVDKDYWQQVNWFASRFVPFEIETDDGILRFNGRGAQLASQAEQRSIYEWAKIALKTSELKVSGPDAGLAAMIKQTGGIAGVCFQTTIHLDGWGYRADCQQPELTYRQYRLTSTELETLFLLYDRLAEVEVSASLPEDAQDAFNYEFRVFGQGKESLRAEDMDQLIRLIRP